MLTQLSFLKGPRFQFESSRRSSTQRLLHSVLPPLTLMLNLPVEIRLAIYEIFLDNHLRIPNNRRQPSNAHLRVLRICRVVHHEARDLFRTYISLSHERQINAFIRYADDHDCSYIERADVANDGRFFQSNEGKPQLATPVSNLHIALRHLRSLKQLRVFECRQGVPMGVHRAYEFLSVWSV